MSDRELTPRTVARLLDPAWRFDGPALAGFSLFDVYAQGRDRVVVELADGERTLSLSLSPASRGLDVAWLAPGPAELGVAAGRALHTLLDEKAGPAQWRVPPDAVLQRPEALASRPARAQLDEDPDRALLAADTRHYARLYGIAPQPVRLTPAGISLHYPLPRGMPAPPSGQLYRVPERFHRRRFAEYFARLGCTYEDGTARTVPTPTTFARAVEHAPVRPRLVQGSSASTSAAGWAQSVVRERVLPVGVAARWVVEVHHRVRRLPGLSRIPVDVGMLAHDVSLHALGFHAVDLGQWRALTDRARALVSVGPRRAAQVAAFFEGPLTRAAWRTWSEVERPEDFAAAFARRARELELELAAV